MWIQVVSYIEFNIPWKLTNKSQLFKERLVLEIDMKHVLIQFYFSIFFTCKFCESFLLFQSEYLFKINIAFFHILMYNIMESKKITLFNIIMCYSDISILVK